MRSDPDNLKVMVEDNQFDQEPASCMVARLLERLCPTEKCSDVDRAILGASLGG